MEDTELVRRMISGDMDAFDRLMEKYQTEALRAAYLISGSYADSEDIVQETFVSCYLNRNQIRKPEAFRGWFYKCLSRHAWRILGRRRREQPAEEIWDCERPGPSQVLSDLIKNEEEEELYSAIRRLPAKQRTVIVLYYFNQMTIREIAGICGCLEGTVKSRLFGGKARLRKILEGDGERGGRTWTILS